MVNLHWNDKPITLFTPFSYKVLTRSFDVYVNVGENKLRFSPKGVSSNPGLTIDNVKLVRYGTTENIAVNGDFEESEL